MATSLALQLVPGLSPSPTLQRYVRSGEAVGALTGVAITGVVDVTNTHVWNFDVSTWASADYFVLLAGVSSPNALPWPCRVTTAGAYPAYTWAVLDATIVATPPIPSAITGLCNVLFNVSLNGAFVVGASVTATLEGTYNTTDGVLVSRSVTSGTTDSSGNCTLTLIQGGQFVVGGSYRIVVSSANVLHVNRLVTIPSTGSANAEDLVAA